MTPRGWPGLAAGIAWSVGAMTGLAWADTVSLSNGRTLEGIIVNETDSHLTLQVTWQGYTTLDRQAVASITRSNDQDHQRLLAQWRSALLVERRREYRQRLFETRQRARGLISYHGQWITPETFTIIQEQQRERVETKRRRALEEELNRQAQRLQVLEAENRHLREEVQFRRQPVLLLPETVVLHRRDPNLFRDEQGNFLRVQEHEGHKFFATPDGKHIDLQNHEGHLAFTDEHGLHHDLRGID